MQKITRKREREREREKMRKEEALFVIRQKVCARRVMIIYVSA
jgi:hypothetical protein